jgi:hypothetical protein
MLVVPLDGWTGSCAGIRGGWEADEGGSSWCHLTIRDVLMNEHAGMKGTAMKDEYRYPTRTYLL